MNYKKIIIWTICIISFFIIFFGLINIKDTKTEDIASNKREENYSELIKTENKDETEILGEVEDECVNEWKDYEEYINKNIEEASNNLADKDTHYILKDVLGYIEIYYLDKNNQQYLYKKTNIPTKYLSQEDIEDLKVGIEVTGIESLNKILEDFE